MTTDKQLVKTMTGEIFQPIRLYYEYINQSGVQAVFNRLDCMDYDETTDRWVWLYQDETKSLKFAKPYKAIPIEKRPIVLGSIFSRVDHEMYIDVGSIDRAIKAITFFNRHLTRPVAELKYIAIYNKLPESMDEHPGSCFDKLFQDVRVEDIDQKTEARVAKMTEAVMAGALLAPIKDRTFELVEAFRSNFYEDGIAPLRSVLEMRQKVAYKRWEGHKDYCLGDVFQNPLELLGLPKLH